MSLQLDRLFIFIPLEILIIKNKINRELKINLHLYFQLKSSYPSEFQIKVATHFKYKLKVTIYFD